MNRSTILALTLGVATGGALGVGADVFAQVSRGNVREPFSASIIDSICVHPRHSSVDAGAGGSVTRRRIDAYDATAAVSIFSVVPDEPPQQMMARIEGLSGACRTDFVAWAQACVLPAVKTQVNLP